MIAVAGLLAAGPARAQQPTAIPDSVRAEAGRKLWSAKACMACHTIGQGDFAAPDLSGLLERRPLPWLVRWLKEPESMYETDDTIKALIEKYNGIRMPNMKLTDAEIDALLHYIRRAAPPAK